MNSLLQLIIKFVSKIFINENDVVQFKFLYTFHLPNCWVCNTVSAKAKNMNIGLLPIFIKRNNGYDLEFKFGYFDEEGKLIPSRRFRNVASVDVISLNEQYYYVSHSITRSGFKAFVINRNSSSNTQTAIWGPAEVNVSGVPQPMGFKSWIISILKFTLKEGVLITLPLMGFKWLFSTLHIDYTILFSGLATAISRAITGMFIDSKGSTNDDTANIA